MIERTCPCTSGLLSPGNGYGATPKFLEEWNRSLGKQEVVMVMVMAGLLPQTDEEKMLTEEVQPFHYFGFFSS